MRLAAEPSEDLGLPGGFAINDREFQLFRNLIAEQTGISLRDSKTTMLSARLSKRLRELGLTSFDAYYQLLQAQGPRSDEFRRLINCITTNKTSFFRENHHFEFLAEQLKQRRGNEPLRIWSAACSTGEEPYSIAITIAETVGLEAGRNVRILASDIDTQVLQFGSEGLYEAEAMAEVPTAYRARYFQAEAGKYRAHGALRNLVTFRHKNLIAPSWEINTKFDFIFCRNALIYFDHETQDRIIRRFLSFLKPHGYLIVGHSEHLHWLTELIEPIGRTIYRFRGGEVK